MKFRNFQFVVQTKELIQNKKRQLNLSYIQLKIKVLIYYLKCLKYVKEKK